MPFAQQSALENRPSHEVFNEWDKKLHRIYALKQKGAFASLQSFAKKEGVKTEVHTWHEKRPHATRHTTSSGGAGANDTTLSVADASVFNVGQVAHAPATSQDMLVTDVDTTANTITVVRQNTLNSNLSNSAIADLAVIGVRAYVLGQGQAGVDTEIIDSTERSTRITDLIREYSYYLNYEVKTNRRGMIAERADDCDERLAEDFDLTFISGRPWTYGSRAERRSSTSGFLDVLAAANKYTLTLATVIGDGIAVSLVDALTDLYDKEYGSPVRYGVCGPSFYNDVQKLAYLWPGSEMKLTDKQDARGINVKQVEFSGYTLRLQRSLFLGRTFNGYYSDHCFIVDPTNVRMIHPEGWQAPKRQKKPNLNNREMGWEKVWSFGLKLTHPETHGLLRIASLAA
jgi:hypothetical protein